MATSARVDLIAGFVVLAIGAAGLSDVLGRGPVGHAMAGDPGPTFLPSLLLYLLLALGAFIVLKAAMGLRRAAPVAGEAAEAARDGSALEVMRRLAPALMAGSLLAYLWAMPRVGFVAATLMFLTVWGALVGLMESGGLARRLWLVPVEAVLATAVLVLLFRTGLRVPLP